MSCYWISYGRNNTMPHTLAPPKLAKEICESMHWNGSGHLATPKSIIENQLFYYLSWNHSFSGSNPAYQKLHIDGRYNRTADQWQWFDGSPIEWKFWRFSKPGNHCLMMDLRSGGAWLNIECDTYQSAYPFICEVSSLNTNYTLVSEPVDIVGKPVNHSGEVEASSVVTGANDGVFAADFAVASGFSIKYVYGSVMQWWRVDMQAVWHVSEVWLYTRKQSGDYPNEHQVWVSLANEANYESDMPNSIRCQLDNMDNQPGDILEAFCDIPAQFVIVRKPQTSTFVMAEVAVYAKKCTMNCIIYALVPQRDPMTCGIPGSLI
ncbi:hypothetical protein BOX15_Mlig013764g1, partial [Macrostomum lignano]